MHLFLKLHQLAASRGDGLRPEWLDLLSNVTSADGFPHQPPDLKVVQPGNHPDGVVVVPSTESVPQLNPAQRKASVS